MPTSRIAQWVLIGSIVFAGIMTPLIAKHLAAAARFTGCGGEEVAAANADYETQVVELVNQFRAQNDLPPLKLNQSLSNAARYHAMDMVQDSYFQHKSYDRVDGDLTPVCEWYDRVAVYYPISGAAENIAWGYTSPTSVMAGWLASEGHRRNILSSNWEIGVGFEGNVWVQDFSHRRDYFPLIINDEAATTTSPAVSLYLYGDWEEMRLRNDDDPWGDWQPFANQVDWLLNAAPGERRVEAELRTNSRTSSTSDTITLAPDAGATPSPSATDDPNRTATETPIVTETATPTPTSTQQPTNTPTATPTFFVTTPPTCDACLDGRVIFEGRPTPPHTSWVTPIVVKLLAYAGESNQPTLLTLPGETSSDGRFRLYDLTPGPYEILVKGSHTLQRGVAVTVTTGLTEVEIGVLPEGDILANNQVDILDFSMLATAYESCINSANFLGAADLNADDCVNEQDLRLLQGNFGRVGDEPAEISAVTAAAAPPMFEVQDLQVGARFGVTLAVNELMSTPIDGAAFYLDFDPAVLQVVSIAFDSQFPLQLQKAVDNLGGRVDLAAGILGGNVPAPFAFATIYFEATQTITNSRIALETSGGRRTDLAAHGASLFDPAGSNVSSIVHLSIGPFDPPQSLYLPLVLR